MTEDELRDIMSYLMDRVKLDESEKKIKFHEPSINEMANAGLNEEDVNRLLNMPWWEEMVEDIIETPDMCDENDSDQDILKYARDVVSEYIRKRFPLNE